VSTEIRPRREMETNIDRLRVLSREAEGGDKAARAELRRVVAKCSPAVIAEASNVARRAERMLMKTISAGEPLMQETLEVRLEQMRGEIAGESPTPLEMLLAERVVAGWLLVEVLEALISAQFRTGPQGAQKGVRVTPAYILQMSKILESATRRHFAAIQALARVRKLQNNTPGVQYNTQINVTPRGDTGERMKVVAAEEAPASSDRGGGCS
jgi:hypothetical protein